MGSHVNDYNWFGTYDDDLDDFDEIDEIDDSRV